jgi:hypothetical protein
MGDAVDAGDELAAIHRDWEQAVSNVDDQGTRLFLAWGILHESVAQLSASESDLRNAMRVLLLFIRAVEKSERERAW